MKKTLISSIIFFILVLSACSTQKRVEGDQTIQVSETRKKESNVANIDSDKSNDLVYREYAFGKEFPALTIIEDLGDIVQNSIENPDEMLILKNDQIYERYFVDEEIAEKIELSDEAYYCFLVIDTSGKIVDITDKIDYYVEANESGLLELQ